MLRGVWRRLCGRGGAARAPRALLRLAASRRVRGRGTPTPLPPAAPLPFLPFPFLSFPFLSFPFLLLFAGGDAGGVQAGLRDHARGAGAAAGDGGQRRRQRRDSVAPAVRAAPVLRVQERLLRAGESASVRLHATCAPLCIRSAWLVRGGPCRASRHPPPPPRRPEQCLRPSKQAAPRGALHRASPNPNVSPNVCAAHARAQIEVFASQEGDMDKWEGWVRSRVRHLVRALEEHVNVRPHPNSVKAPPDLYPGDERPRKFYFLCLTKRTAGPVSAETLFWWAALWEGCECGARAGCAVGRRAHRRAGERVCWCEGSVEEPRAPRPSQDPASEREGSRVCVLCAWLAMCRSRTERGAAPVPHACVRPPAHRPRA